MLNPLNFVQFRGFTIFTIIMHVVHSTLLSLTVIHIYKTRLKTNNVLVYALQQHKPTRFEKMPIYV